MKLAFSTLACPDFTWQEIYTMAKDMGFDGIEFIDLSPENGMSEAEYAKLLREESEKLSLPITAYTISANLLCDAGLDAEVERICRKVDIAEILGAKVMRHDAAWGMPEDLKKQEKPSKFEFMNRFYDSMEKKSQKYAEYKLTKQQNKKNKQNKGKK